MDRKEITADLRAQRDRLDKAISALEELVGTDGRRGRAARSTAPAGRRHHRISVEGRRRIAAAMRARWAKKKGTLPQQNAAAKQGTRRKRGITAAGRKRLSEMMKKRWAERRKQAKSA